ncbi:MAG: glycosyltransferase family 2 protein [Bacteroidales bacterium]|jgi:glycosyltransferase involved in cell wall biosynthesis
MAGISAVIITYNEEKSIERCLSSLGSVPDEIVVVDSFSTDATAEICRKFGARVVEHEFTGYMDQRNYADTLAANDFILMIDADEALSPELHDSLVSIKDNLTCDGYIFNRLGNFCGQWIRHSAWHPDRQLRLFNRKMGKWGPINVHETFHPVPGSKTERVRGDLLHWPVSSVADHAKTIESYAAIAAREYFKKGKKVSFFTPVLHQAWRFFMTYFVRLGFLDGRNGYIICCMSARSSYLKYSGLRKLWLNEGRNKRTINEI